MKNIFYLIIISTVVQSCYRIKKNETAKPCEYSILINNEIIESADRKDIIWLSTYTSGVNYRKLRKKIDIPGMKLDFTITEKNLRQKVFNKICEINKFKLDSVVFFNMEPDNRISYRLVFKKGNPAIQHIK